MGAGRRGIYLRQTNGGRTLAHVVNRAATGADVSYPFRQMRRIGDQHQWLQRCIEQEAVVTPYTMQDIGQQQLE